MSGTPSWLLKIYARKREEVTENSRHLPLSRVRQSAESAGASRGFVRSLCGGTGCIAEIKRASPSAGTISEVRDVAEVAFAYAGAGASCLSVLTDRDFFHGADEDLLRARATVRLPVLRKDFVYCEYQLYEARALGADCLLLIVVGLEPSQLQQLYALGGELGMDVLLEVHSADELEQALVLDPSLIGINNRDLHSLAVDLATAERLLPQIPEGVLKVAESGIVTAEDLQRMRDAGADAFLIGTSLMAQPDPGEALRRLLAEANST